MIINFIRHGKTSGNLEKKFIGTTDEPLCIAGKQELLRRIYPDCDLVISSSMIRCIETAQLIYPDKKIEIFSGFNECDFGDLEGKNYLELSDNIVYQKWLDSNGKNGFPNGEKTEEFKMRCINEFEKTIKKFGDIRTISYVIHGGTIMSILEKFAVPKHDFYDYQAENGRGFMTELCINEIKILERI